MATNPPKARCRVEFKADGLTFRRKIVFALHDGASIRLALDTPNG